MGGLLFGVIDRGLERRGADLVGAKTPRCGVFSGRLRSARPTAKRGARAGASEQAEQASPSAPATSPQASLGLRRLFCCTNKSPLRFVSLRLLTAKGHARFAYSLASALITAHCRCQPFAGYRTARMGGLLFGVIDRGLERRGADLVGAKYRSAVFLADGCGAQDRLRSAEREQARLNKRSRRVLLPLPQ